MSNVAINIAAEFVGKGAFDKANKSVTGLERSVKKMAAGLGVGLGLSALTAFGKAAVKAFSADEVSARRLATAVDNLGLSFSQTRVTDFIANLEKSAGIADDVLRPAFQALLNTTGSLTKSQELLSNAIQISRASGIDLATVSQDLANGFVGITRGLKKYNTGLTQSELKTKGFNEILGVMLAKSAGAAQDYLTTTAYKMDVLTVATDNAKETIGKGLIDAFARIGGGTEASDAAKAIDNIAKATSNVIVVLGTAIGAIEKFRKGYTNFLAGGDINAIMAGTQGSTNRSKSPAGTAVRTAQQRAAEVVAAKRAKELAALTTKQVKAQKDLTAEQKKQALLKKAGSIFDLDQIQLIAALKGKLSEEDRKRVELQFALIVGNTAEAQKLTYEIAKAQGLGEHLANYLASLPDAKNPFASWSAYLDMLQSKAQQVASVSGAVVVTASSTATNVTGGGAVIQSGQNGAVVSTNVAALPSSTPGSFRAAEAASNLTGPIQVNVQIDGKTIATATQSQSLSGIPSNVSRINGNFTG